MILAFIAMIIFLTIVDTSDWFMDEETEYLLYNDLDDEEENNVGATTEDKLNKASTEATDEKNETSKNTNTESENSKKHIKNVDKVQKNKGIDIDTVMSDGEKVGSMYDDEFASMSVDPEQLAKDLVNDVYDDVY